MWGVTADPDLRQDADGRYLRLGVRHRLKRTADLDGEVDAEPGMSDMLEHLQAVGLVTKLAT